MAPWCAAAGLLLVIASCSDYALQTGQVSTDVSGAPPGSGVASVTLAAELECALVDESPALVDGTCTAFEGTEFPFAEDDVARNSWTEPTGTFEATLERSPDTGCARVAWGEESGPWTVLDGCTLASRSLGGPDSYAGGSGSATWVEPTGELRYAGMQWQEVGYDIGIFSSLFSPVVSVPAPSGRYADLLVADLDGDGAVEIVGAGEVLHSDGEVVGIFPAPEQVLQNSPAAFDVDGDGIGEVVNAVGIWQAFGENEGVRWTWPAGDDRSGSWPFSGAPVLVDGQVHIVGSTVGAVFLADASGVVQWIADVPQGKEGSIGRFGLGDVDGDGESDICTPGTEAVHVLNLMGEATQEYSYGRASGQAGTGCSMADLNADGVYEMYALGPQGFQVIDGLRQRVVYQDPEAVLSASPWGGPMIGDLDGDGSAEVVVSGFRDVTYSGFRLRRVYSSASGSWARTRPVWNQYNYDATTVHDNGRIVADPIPSWEAYGGLYRGQPAHDGDFPDLLPELVDSCADECGSGGTVLVLARVQNAGSADAPAGSRLRLRTRIDGTWAARAEVTLAEGIPSLGASESVVIELPYEQLGTAQVLEVEAPAGTPECDRVNDRANVEIDACGQ